MGQSSSAGVVEEKPIASLDARGSLHLSLLDDPQVERSWQSSRAASHKLNCSPIPSPISAAHVSVHVDIVRRW